MKAPHRLYTIGHSNRSIDEFVALLHQHHVACIADVRSQPTSARFPYFNADPLRSRLRAEDIDYKFWGDELGARRQEPDCYEQGQAKYSLIAKAFAFQQGLDQLRLELERHPIALMCAEKDPLSCHRTILVCRQLRGEFEIEHIIDNDAIETQAKAEARLLDMLGLPTRDLFRGEEEMLSDAYDAQAEKIAYRSSAPTDSIVYE
jgi:uncharacterized protein (DUF488 family)